MSNTLRWYILFSKYFANIMQLILVIEHEGPASQRDALVMTILNQMH